MRGRSGRRWDEALSWPAPEAIAELIPDIIDEVLVELLDAIDNDLVPLAWISSDGNVVALSELGLGEMARWYTSGEWPKRFSSKRWIDLFLDLKLKKSLTRTSSPAFPLDEHARGPRVDLLRAAGAPLGGPESGRRICGEGAADVGIVR
jgi:hypothetical protein